MQGTHEPPEHRHWFTSRWSWHCLHRLCS